MTRRSLSSFAGVALVAAVVVTTGACVRSPTGADRGWAEVTAQVSERPAVPGVLRALDVSAAPSPPASSPLAYDAEQETASLRAALETALVGVNLFGGDARQPVDVRAELLGYQSPQQAAGFVAVATVRYVVTTPARTIFDREIVTRHGAGSQDVVGYVRLSRARRLALVTNVEEFRRELEPALIAYTNGTLPEIVRAKDGATTPRTEAIAAPTAAKTPPALRALEAGAYHALLIGNSAYESFPPLIPPAGDAREVGRVLDARYGFAVTMLLDATLEQMQAAIERLVAQSAEADSLLIYFAGHSSCDESGQQGYWLPVDAEPGARETWLATHALSASMRGVAAKHVLVVVDGCYAPRLLRGGPPPTRDEAYLETLSRRRARVVLTSGAEPGVVRSETSILADALTRVLEPNEGILEGDAVYARVRKFVREESTDPVEYSDISRAGNPGGDFLFIPR